MIRYMLRCDTGHEFEGWFRSSEAYEKQRASGLVACGFCGSTAVEKMLMAPAVSRRETSRQGADPTPENSQKTPRPEARMTEALSKLRAHIEANSDYVGNSFATEARAMHTGESPHRAIHGEAGPDEARALIEDGIPVAPLPFIPRQKTN